MIKNEIYCYINDFLKRKTSKKIGCNVGNKKLFGKICFLNLRNRRKSIFARVIKRNQRLKKITKEKGKIITKSTYRWNNRTKFRIWITRGKSVHFRSTMDTSRSRTNGIQFINSFSLKKVFIVSTYVVKLRVVVKLYVLRLDLY